eukprot:4222_1
MSYKIHKRPRDDSSDEERSGIKKATDNKSINKDETEWLSNLKVGDKLDFNSGNGKWEIGTINKIRAIIQKNKKYIHINSDTTNKSKTLAIAIDSCNIKANIIFPLNTKTAYHQYLNNSNINIARVCRANNDNKCYVCERLMCSECALIKQRYKLICGECINSLKKKEMSKCIQKVMSSDINTKIVNIICDFAVGTIVLCCNEHQNKKKNNCEKMIYFDNWFKNIYDYYGKNIYYYKANKQNNLKCIRMNRNSLNTKIRIFCSVCTQSKLKNCR